MADRPAFRDLGLSPSALPQGSDPVRSTPLNPERVARSSAGLPVQQDVDGVVSLQTFQFDLQPEIVGAVGVDQGLFQADAIVLV